MLYDVAIVGGSASGMACAVTAARRGLTVLLIEKNTQTGRKLRATGNGKCNIANSYYDESCYRGSNQNVIRNLVGPASYEQTLAFMRSLGLPVMSKNGYYYPASQQATAVISALNRGMEHAGVVCVCGRSVTDVRYEQTHFEIRTEISEEYKKEMRRAARKAGGHAQRDAEMPVTDDRASVYKAKKVVLATGGYAGSQYGCSGDGYVLAQHFGHHIMTPLPALVPLISHDTYCKLLAGVRVAGHVSIRVDQLEIYGTDGEIQFTEYGASGICVFMVSRIAAKALELGKDVELRIDFMPQYSFDDLLAEIDFLFGNTNYLSVADSLRGFVPEKLADVILMCAGVDGIIKACKLDISVLRRIVAQLKQFEMHIAGCKDYDMAQVTAGGVDITEITADYESRLQPGLYMVGELLDVDGTCGGYNLTFAFLSGIHAGEKL